MIFSKNDPIIISTKLLVVVLKVGLILGEKSLKGSLISLIRSRLIYLISFSLLDSIKKVNLLLKLSNLAYYFLGIIIIIRGGWGLRYHYIFVLLS